MHAINAGNLPYRGFHRGLAALGAGIGEGNLPPALAVGYGVTALGALFMVVGMATFGSDGERQVALIPLVCCILPAFLVPLALTAGWFM